MEEEKRGFKEWWRKKTLPIREWVGKHPDACFYFIGGVCSLLGGAIKLYTLKNEYEDHVYTVIEDEVYKMPAKKLKTAKHTTTEK